MSQKFQRYSRNPDCNGSVIVLEETMVLIRASFKLADLTLTPTLQLLLLIKTLFMSCIGRYHFHLATSLLLFNFND